MYNAELKKKFLDTYGNKRSTRRTAARVLERFSEVEKEWGADLCTKTVEELQPVIDNGVGIRSASQCTAVNNLREYVKWCIASGVPGACDGMLRVQVVGIDSIRKHMVANPLELQRYLDSVFDALSSETVDIVYRCHCWMAFGGMEERDTILVKCSDIDFNLMSIIYNGTSFPLYKEAIPTFRKAVELTTFRYEHPNYKPVRKNRISGDAVMRRFTPDVNDRTIRSALTRYTTIAFQNGKTEKRLSFRHIQLSGMFYRLYENERAGLPVNFEQIAQDYVDSKTYKFNEETKEAQLTYKKRQVEKDFIEDYQRWKLAFSV